MVTVTTLRENGEPVGFRLKGHAEHGDYGYDLVCAAISGVVQTTILGITEVLKADAGFSLEENNTSCVLSKDATEDEQRDTALLINTMLKGLEAIENAYPGTLKFDIREV
ncbi:MAG: ribosomal-processing cysteine protease Prp [Eubacteriales bacterium]|nr:ribosomal-processing cysteine protease Prp [Eubacteriales bacterium]